MREVDWYLECAVSMPYSLEPLSELHSHSQFYHLPWFLLRDASGLGKQRQLLAFGIASEVRRQKFS